MSISFNTSTPPLSSGSVKANISLVELLNSPDSVVVYSPEGYTIKYTLDGTDPKTSNNAITETTGSAIIPTYGNKVLIKAVSIDNSGEFSEIVTARGDTEVDIILHPIKDVYEVGDIVTATLNSTTNGTIQTYEDYRWENEQKQNRFDQPEDDDIFLGPRPTFKLSTIGKFRVKVAYRDHDFPPVRKRKLFEVYPKLKIKYKGLEEEYKQESIVSNENNVSKSLLGGKDIEL